MSNKMAAKLPCKSLESKETPSMNPVGLASTAKSNVGTAAWDSLMTQLRVQLCAMASDECYSRALELQMLARSEVGRHGLDLFNSMELMAIGQPVLEPSSGFRRFTRGSFVPISPMTTSSRPAKRGKQATHHDMHPSRHMNSPTCSKKLSPPQNHVSITPLQQMPSLTDHDLSNNYHMDSVTLMPNHTLRSDDSMKMCTLGFRPSPTLPESDLNGAVLATDGRGQLATWGPQNSPIRTASKWSKICAAKLQKQVKRKVKKDAVGTSNEAIEASTGGGRGRVNGISNPTKLDVLSGRGSRANRHAGNVVFRNEARKIRSVYQNNKTSRDDKFWLSQELVNRVQEYGGRFLGKGEDGMWYEVDNVDARKKASQALRENKWEKRIHLT